MVKRPERLRLQARRLVLLEAQGYRCAVCAVPLSADTAVLDHDHQCCPKKAREACGHCDRSVMCLNCNIALGQIKESADIAVRLEGFILGQRFHNAPALRDEASRNGGAKAPVQQEMLW